MLTMPGRALDRAEEIPVGPTCEVIVETADNSLLDVIDGILAGAAERIERTRKGRVWEVWVGGRPVHVSVGGTPLAVVLAAGGNLPRGFRGVPSPCHRYRCGREWRRLERGPSIEKYDGAAAGD